jgi:AcrR family transcriptional regulator
MLTSKKSGMSKPPNLDLVRRILDIALEELGAKPPDKVNMRSIAERAGVSPTAIYYYFASKDELFERIKFDIMDELGARIAAATARGGSARDRLAALVRAYVEWCLERPHLARLLMEELPPQEELTEEKMRKYYVVFFAARDLIEEAAGEGSLSPRDAELDASMGQAGTRRHHHGPEAAR